VEAIGDLGDFAEEIAATVGVGVVVEVTRVQHRVQQLLLGFEMMQQPRGADPGFAGYLGERCVTPAVARQQPLRDGKNPLFAVLALGEKRVVWPCVGHRTPQDGLQKPTEHTVGWFAGRGKGSWWIVSRRPTRRAWRWPCRRLRTWFA